MSDKIVHLSDSGFEADVLKAEGPIWLISGLNGAVRAR